MKKIILAGVVFLTFTSFISLNAQWARTYGGSLDDYALSIQQTSDGGYIAAGTTLSFADGVSNLWVLKLSSYGEIQWQRTYGGSAWDGASSIQQTGDEGYIVTGYTLFGSGGEDFWVLKLTSNGDIEWQRAYGGSDNEYNNSVQQTDDGGYVVAGFTRTFGSGGEDFWVLKLSSNGDIEWQRTYGGSADDRANYIQQTGDGGYIVAGYTKSFGAGEADIWVLKLSTNGDIEWQRTYGGSGGDYAYSIQEADDGGYIVAGSTGSFGAGEADIWVLKLSSNGDIEWQRTYGGSRSEFAFSIQETSDGGYIAAGFIGGFFEGKSDSLVLKMTSDGDIEWQRAYGGDQLDYFRSVRQITNERHNNVSFIDSSEAGKGDSRASKLSSNSKIKWKHPYGYRNYDHTHSSQQTSYEGYIVAGSTKSFGAGRSDFWVLKLSLDGDVDPSCEFIGSSNATVSDTSILPFETSVIPMDTSVTPLDTHILPQDTDVNSNLLCASQFKKKVIIRR